MLCPCKAEYNACRARPKIRAVSVQSAKGLTDGELRYIF